MCTMCHWYCIHVQYTAYTVNSIARLLLIFFPLRVSNDSGLARLQLGKTRKELSVKQCHEDELKIKISQLE